MTFYISEFWCGVIATVVIEVSAVIIAAVISVKNDKKKKGEGNVEEKVDGLIGTYNDCVKWDSSESGRD